MSESSKKTPQAIHDLVERFSTHYDSYKLSSYNETQLRREFLDPFLEALGWDVNNTQGLGEAYKEVILEDAIKFGGYTKAPDYCLRIGGGRKFFVEAKKPAVNIKEDINPAYQLRRYAWSAKMPVGILTDFEEFIVFDTTPKPHKSDSAAKGRVLYIKFTEYIDRWDEIASVFSKEAILKGQFDAFTEKSRTKKGTDEVDDEFLKEIEKWRELLAKDLAINNAKLSFRDLNFGVQKIIDRIVFLRICEDRGIEDYGQLMALQNGERVYKRLVQIFQRADDKYNSGLFHFKTEKDIYEAPDEITPGLSVSDTALKTVFKNLYYPESPYEFSVLPADILGQVYEQFLGKVIHLTSGHKAVIEDKPEVKKAGGVYYTPTYIVEYIVKNTVGKILENKTPKQVEKIRILDPACGSGSFLIGSYQYLLDWHRDYYSKDPEKYIKGRNPILYKARSGEWRLTTAEKKRILLNNIFGVDIDAQAVEVTKLSLSLKILEGENEESLNRQLRLFQDRALPDLGKNIKCGNSLIGPDYFSDQLIPDTEELLKINPFDWSGKDGFLEIMEKGGFGVVIGNPPYSSKQSLETKKIAKLFKLVEYKCDPYALFIEKGQTLLKRGGYLGYIIPVTWMTNVYYQKLRRMMIDSHSLKRIILMQGNVFKNANVDTTLLFLEKEAVNKDKFEWAVETPPNFKENFVDRNYTSVKNSDRYDISPNFNSNWEVVKNKIDALSGRLDDLCKISLGMKLKSNELFVSEKTDSSHADPIYFGKDIGRYSYLVPKHFFNFKNAVIVGGTKRLEIQKAIPKIFIQAIRNLSLSRRIVATLDDKGHYFIGTLNAATQINKEYNILYILGLINSTLLNTYFRNRFTTISLTAAFLGILPIYKINFLDEKEKKKHGTLVPMVGQMLDLNSKLLKTKIDQEKIVLQRQIDTLDRQIDQFVYQLYNLTSEEVKIVEGN
ncbi:MAG: N-6 DNA methylase [Candidatus Taylorbacteria bacterium]|nr:N-6 DNA methylase [Candidatus Taylorbacteria bacterium]